MPSISSNKSPIGNCHQNLDVFFQSLHAESIGLLLLHSRLIRPVQIHLQFGWYTFPLSEGCLRPLYFPYHQHIIFSPTTTLSPGCLLHCHKRLERIGTAAICLVPLRLKKGALEQRWCVKVVHWWVDWVVQQGNTMVLVPSDLVPKAWWGDVTKFSFAALLLVFWAGNEREAYPAPEKMFHLSTTVYHSRSWPRQAISFHFVINHGWAHHRKWFEIHMISGNTPKKSSRTLQGPLVSHELASLFWSKYNTYYRQIQLDTAFQKLKSHKIFNHHLAFRADFQLSKLRLG